MRAQPACIAQNIQLVLIPAKSSGDIWMADG